MPCREDTWQHLDATRNVEASAAILRSDPERSGLIRHSG